MSGKDGVAGAAAVGEDLSRLVYQDDLTKTFNRRYFYKYLQEEVPWTSRDGVSLCLLMIDLDHFKKINDRFGHLEGDNALIHVAKLFQREIADDGFVVRYAGDEFTVLLPGRTKEDGRALGERILQLLSEEELRIESASVSMKLALSIGVSAFPEDATDPTSFIEEADRALYASKRGGRNRVSVAGNEVRREAANFRALDVIPCSKAIGRAKILETFRGILDATRWTCNTAVFVQGGPGTGKSRVLREVEAEGKTREVPFVSHACLARDRGQPFALLAEILEGFGSSIRENRRRRLVSPDTWSALHRILPGLFPTADEEPKSDGEEEPDLPEVLSERLFEGAKAILREAAHGKPIVLLIDNLQHADPESLRILGRILREEVVPLVFASGCREEADSRDTLPRKILGMESGNESDRVSLVELRLTPLSPPEVEEVLRAVFDGLAVDRGIVHEVWGKTRGNPLYVEELLKWMVHQGYIRRDVEGWQIGEVPWEEAPETLEAAVRGDLASVDVETDDILARAAALGTAFDLETIREISGKGTGEVLELLDRGTDARIIRPTDPFDPDRFEFVSAFTQELKASETSEECSQEIHARIADLEERMNADNLDRVLGRLEYHWSRSNNAEKAREFHALVNRRWRQVPVDPNEPSVEEVLPSHRRGRARIREADAPLGAHELGLMRNVVRYLSATFKNRFIYPAGSRMIQESTQGLFEAMREVFKTCRVFTISNMNEDMVINGKVVDPKKFIAGNRELLDLFRRYQIQSLTISAEVQMTELEGLRDLLYERTKADECDPEYWDRNLDEKGIRNLAIDQRLYVIAGPDGPAAGGNGEGEERPDPETEAAPVAEPAGNGDDASRFGGSLKRWFDSPFSAEGDALLEDFVGDVLRLLESEEPREKQAGSRLFGEFVARLREIRERERLLALADKLILRLDRGIRATAFGPIAQALAQGARELIERGHYDAAARFVRFLGYNEGREGTKPDNARAARKALNDLLRSASFDLVVADLTSQDVARQGAVRDILLGFNDLVIERLLRVVKESEDIRTRKFTALLLSELGDRAVKRIKRELVQPLVEHEYKRLLGILDSFEGDFKDELLSAMCHEDASVRSEALKLLRRTCDDVHRLLLDVLGKAHGSAACEAVQQLGRLKAVEAVDTILGKVRGGGASDQLLYEGCIAFGRIGDARPVAFLKEVLGENRFPFLRTRHSSKVRFSAAWALAQIGTSEALEGLARCRRDRDSEVRALAVRATKS